MSIRRTRRRRRRRRAERERERSASCERKRRRFTARRFYVGRRSLTEATSKALGILNTTMLLSTQPTDEVDDMARTDLYVALLLRRLLCFCSAYLADDAMICDDDDTFRRRHAVYGCVCWGSCCFWDMGVNEKSTTQAIFPTSIAAGVEWSFVEAIESTERWLIYTCRSNGRFDCFLCNFRPLDEIR